MTIGSGSPRTNCLTMLAIPGHPQFFKHDATPFMPWVYTLRAFLRFAFSAQFALSTSSQLRILTNCEAVSLLPLQQLSPLLLRVSARNRYATWFATLRTLTPLRETAPNTDPILSASTNSQIASEAKQHKSTNHSSPSRSTGSSAGRFCRKR